MTWMDFKKTFTQSQEDALWQYFIDHSQIQPNGFWHIQFFVRDIDDFWKRVHARESGDFIRYDQFQKKDIQTSKLRSVGRQIHQKKVAIQQSGSLYSRFLLWVYRLIGKSLWKDIQK